MKNLLIYINPSGLNSEAETLLKIQIDNLLDLGWKAEDIIIWTNFKFEYNGIRSRLVWDDYFYAQIPISTKQYAIAQAFKDNIIEDHLYWVHDLDHFQLEPISEEEILKEMEGADMALCDWGSTVKYSGGSVFFKKSAGDIFTRLRLVMEKYNLYDERALLFLTTNNKNWIYKSYFGVIGSKSIPGKIRDSRSIRHRIKILNITYNFIPFNISYCYRKAIKPIRCIHFNPFPESASTYIKGGCAKDIFMSGHNSKGIILITDRLRKIFNKHGIE